MSLLSIIWQENEQTYVLVIQTAGVTMASSQQGGNIIMGAQFNRNMSFLDRLMRVIAGAVLIYIGFFATQLVDNTIINLLLGLLGLLNLAAALTAFCPVYKLADFKTKKSDHH